MAGRAITIWEVIQKRSHETIYKTHTKIEAKILRATTFDIAKLEERKLNGEQQRQIQYCHRNIVKITILKG